MSGRLRSRDVLQQRLGRLKLEYSRVARAYRFLVEGNGDTLNLSWTEDEARAQYMRHAEDAYLLRTNLAGHDEPELWKMYMQLNDAEAALLRRTLTPDGSPDPNALQGQVAEAERGVAIEVAAVALAGLPPVGLCGHRDREHEATSP